MRAWLCREIARAGAGLGAAARWLEHVAGTLGTDAGERKGRADGCGVAIGPGADAGNVPAADLAAHGCEALASCQAIRRALSHDLRAPQSAILALAELHLAEPSRLGPEAFVAQLAGYARASLRLTDDVARLVREFGHAYRMEVLELTALLREAAGTPWEPEDAGDAAPWPELDLAGRKVWMRGDTAMLSEALRVLTAQARAAARGGTPMQVRQRIDGRACRVSIVFARGTGAAPGHGAGPSMQYCRRVVLRHGGALDLEARAAADERVAWHLLLPVLP